MKLNTISNQDCIKGMQDIQPNSVDLVITDPPFGIKFGATKANYNRKDNLVLKGYNEIDVKDYRKFSIDWIRQIHRVLKESGQAFIFSGYNNILDVSSAIDSFGFTVVAMPIWQYSFGIYCKNRWVNSHYNIFNIAKNEKKITFNSDCRFTNSKDRYHDIEDVFHVKKEYWTRELKTPTKLPFKLVEKIMQYCSNENDIVLDPFLGSGMTAIVAKTLKRNYLGFEITPQYYEFAKEMLG